MHRSNDNLLYTVYPFMVCTRLRVFVIIFAKMLARQTEAGRQADAQTLKTCIPFAGILYTTRMALRDPHGSNTDQLMAVWRVGLDLDVMR